MLLHLALPVRCGRPSALPARSPATSLRRARPLRTAPAPPHATPGGDARDDDLSPSSAAALRAGPLIAGCVGIAGVLLNRVAGGVSLKKKKGDGSAERGNDAALLFFFFPSLLSTSPLHPLSQVAPTIAAGSAQSRADVVAILLSAVLVLTGLQWLTLAPKTPEPVRRRRRTEREGRVGFVSQPPLRPSSNRRPPALPPSSHSFRSPSARMRPPSTGSPPTCPPPPPPTCGGRPPRRAGRRARSRSSPSTAPPAAAWPTSARPRPPAPPAPPGQGPSPRPPWRPGREPTWPT